MLVINQTEILDKYRLLIMFNVLLYIFVAEIPHQSNCKSPIKIPVYSRQVNITSLASDKMGCGNEADPYILEAQQGQTLNVTLIDFGYGKDVIKNCGIDFQYGSLMDSSKNSHQTTICGGRERIRNIYSSQGHTIHLRVPQKKDRKYHFIIGVMG